MKNQNVKPAEGKLGILVVGLGAVTSTFMTGVLMARKGLSKPVGSMTQYDKIRVGKGADKKYLSYSEIVPMAKLDDIVFNIPEGDYMKPWTFTSSDGRFEMDFVPVLDRASKTDVKVIVSDQHQVFGRMSGKAVLDDGTVLEIKDFMCFAEDVHNRY